MTALRNIAASTLFLGASSTSLLAQDVQLEPLRPQLTHVNEIKKKPLVISSSDWKSMNAIKVYPARLNAFISQLKLTTPPDSFDLLKYQTPNKSQVNGRDWGACVAFSMIGAIEANYKRACMLETPGAPPSSCDIDLSEEYLVHLNSQFSTLNTLSLHENWTSYHNAHNQRPDWDGPPLFVGHLGAALPLELAGAKNEGRTLSYNERKALAQSAGVFSKTGLTQKKVDAYEYDQNHFSPNLRKRAIYGVETVEAVNFKDSSVIEKLLYNDLEIATGYNNEYLVGTGQFDKNAEIMKFDRANGCSVDCGGHAVLVIGYDKINKRYLVKNSYGPSSNHWIPYFKDDGVTPVFWGGSFIKRVRDPKLGPSKNAMWIGKWDMDHDGWQGDLVIRRTSRARNENNNYAGGASLLSGDLPNPPRIGSYNADNKAHPVFGYTTGDGDRLKLWVAFNNNNDRFSDTLGVVTQSAQLFDLTLYDNGDMAAGRTQWNDIFFGAMIKRAYVDMPYSQASGFTRQNWVGDWTLQFSDLTDGRLKISSIETQMRPVLDSQGNVAGTKPFYTPSGTYTAEGKDCVISGNVKGHVLEVKLCPGDLEKATFYGHTKEAGLFSGFDNMRATIGRKRKTLFQRPRFQRLDD